MASILVELRHPYTDMAEKIRRAVAAHLAVSHIADRVYVTEPLKHSREAVVSLMVQAHEAVADEFFKEMAEFFAPHCEFFVFREFVKGLPHAQENE